jgi:glycosyltransferase involved in cell wall biosynthesis
MALTAILFVIDNLEFGGGERGVLQLVQALAADGWGITVAAQAGGPFEAGVRGAGAAFVPVAMTRRAGLGTVLRLRGLVRAGGFALVHSQGARADFLTRLALLGLPGPRLVSTVQMPVEGFDVNPVRQAFYRVFDGLGRGRVDRFIVVSRALQRLLVEKRGLAAGRVALVANGVETDRLTPAARRQLAARARRALGVGEATLLVGAAGRLVWQKGFADLVAAMPGVLARVPAARLVIAGDGPLRDVLATQGRCAGLGDRLVLPGFQADIVPFLAALDVLVIPSVREGFPLITLEGMALGLPIVATAIDGVVEQIQHDTDGLLVPPGDPAALGAAVVRVLEDRTLGERLGQAARRQAVACFDVGRTLDATRRVYTALLEAPGAAEPAR